MEHVLAISFKRKDGKFTPDTGTVVGKVLANGKIEGTDYQFTEGICGGVAITTNQRLEQVDNDTLYNPATKDHFEKSKSGKGYWSPVSKTFVKVWNRQSKNG